MIVSDYSMWLPMMFMMFPGMYQRSKGAVLKRFLVDFMNPEYAYRNAFDKYDESARNPPRYF